jgi:hypothetical protein
METIILGVACAALAVAWVLQIRAGRRAVRAVRKQMKGLPRRGKRKF